MNSQACEPCAKRKVRCDKGQPCSNCRRRRKDHCTYPDASPFDRIKKLEALVRSLGGDPERGGYPAERSIEPQSASSARKRIRISSDYEPGLTAGKIGDPVMLEEDGQPVYLESCAWHSWMAPGQGKDVDVAMRTPFQSRKYPNALQSIFCGNNSIDLVAGHPSQQDAITLWGIYYNSVNRLTKLSFTWALDKLKSVSTNPESRLRLTNEEHAFIFAVYFVSVVSVTEEDCNRDFGRPRSWLCDEFQVLCEQALARTDVFCIKDIMVLRACTLYIMAGLDRLSTPSLWSFMGLVSRNAEKLGIHRDGALLGLSPVETEERRRLWWQLQHLDLALCIKSGSTPLTLMASWDTKMPLNIEDDDINPSMTRPPKERKGLTSMSYSLWTYWVLQEQRSFFHRDGGRLGLSWTASKSISHSTKQEMINQLEEGSNANFLQYCDPIKPLDTLVQIFARVFICMMRMAILHPLAYSGDPELAGEKRRNQLLDICMKALEYDIVAHSNLCLKPFRWRVESFFPWHAFICVLVEAGQLKDPSKTQRLWDLLSNLYSVNLSLSRFAEDRRRPHAAELVIAAWKNRENSSDLEQCPQKPAFVTDLESRLAECRSGVAQSAGGIAAQQGVSALLAELPTQEWSEQDFNAFFDLDFLDIDWSFWSSID